MGKIEKQIGIVLKKRDYKDNAVILSILTEQGIESLILRGSKKITAKNRNLANIYSLISFNNTTDKTINTLTEGVVIDPNLGVYQDLDKINLGSIILEKILVLSSSITDFKTLFNFVKRILSLLDKTKYPEVVISLFEIKLTYLLGIGPNFNSCSKCHKKDSRMYFSLNNGGVLCEECKTSSNDILTLELSTYLKYLYLVNIDLVNEDFLEKYQDLNQEISNIIDLYYNNYLDFNSKSKEIIKKITK